MNTCAVLQESHANRDLMSGVLLTEIQTLVAPLRRLDERTRASIMVLIGLAELVTANERSGAGVDEGVGAEFDRSLVTMHGEGARLLAQMRRARQTAASSGTMDSPLEALMDVLRCLSLPAPVPYERRGFYRRVSWEWGQRCDEL